MDVLAAAFARYRDHGDLDALGRVFDSVSPKLLALALHLTGNAADAEDVLQATFLVALRKADEFDSRQPLAPWLTGILTGEASNVRRREGRRRTAALPDDLPSQDDDAGSVSGRRELVAQMRTHIDALPAEQRQVLLLQLEHGLQPAEIAEVLTVAPGTVRMRIHRGLAALRKILPASLGVALASGLKAMAQFAPRGLAQVREVVLQAGAEHVVTTVAAAGVGAAAVVGGIAMKKVMVGVLSVVAAVLVYLAVLAPRESRAPDEHKLPSASLQRAGASEAIDDIPAVRTPSAAAASHEELAAATGGVHVTVRGDIVMRTSAFESQAISSAGSGVPMAGVSLEVWAGSADHLPTDGKLLRVSADGEGVAQIDGLLPGAWRVVAVAGGVRLSSPRGVAITGGSVVELELHVAIGGELRGKVVDVGGVPVAGAQVWAGNRLQDVVAPERSLRLAAVTDANGRFVAAHTQDEEYLAARKPGFAASRSHPIQQLGGGEVVLRLGLVGAAVAGVVVDELQRPLANIAVSIEPKGKSRHRTASGSLVGPRLASIARTDPAGRYSIDGLAPGSYLLRASRLPLTPAKHSLRIAAGDRKQVRFEMKRRAAVYGYLLDRSGSPQVGVYVMLRRPDGSSQTALSNPDGSYRFEGVPFAPFRLAAHRMSTETTVEKACETPSASATRIDLVLDEGARLSGTVQTRSGRMLGGWWVVASTMDEQASGSTFLNAAGKFEIWGLEPGQYRLRFHRDKDKPRSLDHTEIGTVGVPMVIRLPDSALPSASCRGHLVAANGEQVVGGWVMVRGQTLGVVEIDPDSQFELKYLPPGRHHLEFGASGLVDGSHDFELTDGQNLELGDVKLTHGATLRVRWQGPTSKAFGDRPPVPWLLNDNGPWLFAGAIDYAIEGDEVVVTRIPAGAYTVHPPHGDELLMAPVPVVLAAGEVRSLSLRLDVGRRRALRFATAAEQSADELLHVTVRGPDGVVLVDQQVGNSGRVFELKTVLPLGRHTVEAQAPTGARYRQLVTVTADVDAQRVIDIARVP